MSVRHGAECATTSPMMRSAGPPSTLGDEVRQLLERADGRFRVRARHPREHADRRQRRAAGGEQACRAPQGAAVMPM